jgi:hypothetical protein
MVERFVVLGLVLTLGLAPGSLAWAGDVAYLPGNDAVTQRFNHAATGVFLHGTDFLEAIQMGGALLADETQPGRANVIKQLLATVDTIAGDYQQANEIYPYIGNGDKAKALLPLIPGSKVVPATDAISTAAQGRKAIFINENHGEPITRVLPYELLAKLRSEGYTHLALETLSRKASTRKDSRSACIDTMDADLCRRGYALDLATTGIYSHEPIYGELIRHALELGFHIVAYDTDDAEGYAREEIGATRLAELMAHDRGARIVVLAGFEHIVKEEGSLAQVFAQKTGVDPLTVDQTALLGVSPALIGYVPQASDPDGAMVFINHSGTLSTQPGEIDISVYRRPFPSLRDSASWLSLGGIRQRHDIDDKPCTAHPCLITARRTGERADSVPADRLVLHERGRAVLYLPPGSYTLSFESGAGRNRRVTAMRYMAQASAGEITSDPTRVMGTP